MEVRFAKVLTARSQPVGAVHGTTGLLPRHGLCIAKRGEFVRRVTRSLWLICGRPEFWCDTLSGVKPDEPMVVKPSTAVLVVDDEPTAREVLVLMLAVVGISAESAPGGEEALEIAEEIEPDVVLTDLHMPKMHGRELVRQLFERLGRKPIVIAASADLDLVDRLQDDPAFYAVLSKPIDASLLMSTVEDAMRSRRISRW